MKNKIIFKILSIILSIFGFIFLFYGSFIYQTYPNMINLMLEAFEISWYYFFTGIILLILSLIFIIKS
jgi:hypothetical protein